MMLFDENWNKLKQIGFTLRSVLLQDHHEKVIVGVLIMSWIGRIFDLYSMWYTELSSF